MNVQDAYNNWADQYDTNRNLTRDLEAAALREALKDIAFTTCLEIGCGTGKNTAWFITKAKHVTAVDLSIAMLEKAKEKVVSAGVDFHQADILQPWDFAGKEYDLVSFSLVLEHIEHLDAIFSKVAACTHTGSHVYIGELHPFKQYSGTKARFDTADGQQVVTCFDHNVSDFTQAAKKYGFAIDDIEEYFDDNDRNTLPRILTILLKKL